MLFVKTVRVWRSKTQRCFISISRHLPKSRSSDSKLSSSAVDRASQRRLCGRRRAPSATLRGCWPSTWRCRNRTPPRGCSWGWMKTGGRRSGSDPAAPLGPRRSCWRTTWRSPGAGRTPPRTALSPFRGAPLRTPSSVPNDTRACLRKREQLLESVLGGNNRRKRRPKSVDPQTLKCRCCRTVRSYSWRIFLNESSDRAHAGDGLFESSVEFNLITIDLQLK